MGDLGHQLWFGCFLPPEARQAQAVVALARFADRLGLDLVGVQDHPYQPRFLDTWTLLSVLAAQTERIRLVPDVINLPLRPPAVLARAAASLDLLSGGRLELGLGAGAFFDAIAAMDGPARTPREATDALAEAIHVIRALWTLGPAVHFDGAHYRLSGAQPGPIPAHPIGIWVGAYKQRMLQLTGRLADGWIPSLAYAPPSELPAMSQIIDAAAQAAGRDPVAIRRVYNVNGRFAAAEQGFLHGPPQLWVEQLTELALDHGMSVFVLGPGADAEGDLRRFAEEVVPGVRAAVEQARAAGRPSPQAPSSVSPRAVQAEVQAETPPRDQRAPHSAALDEATRPRRAHNAAAPLTAIGRQSQATLLQVHEHLRQELEQIREAAAEVAAGMLEPAQARSLIYQMTIRQNEWTLGTFCAQYCRVVSIHHTIEDTHLFPQLAQEEASLEPVLERLHAEHEVIAAQLERFDQALIAMMTAQERIADVRRVADDLADMLLSHLAYEEDELLGPLGQLEILV